jgi:transposase
MGNTAGQKRDFDALERRRFDAIDLFRKGLKLSQIARELQVARQTVTRWVGHYRQEGEASLRKAGRAGRRPLLNAGQVAELRSLLVRNPEESGFRTPFWNCSRVAKFIEREFGVRYHPGHVWKLLDGLGLSRQRLLQRAVKRDETANLA